MRKLKLIIPILFFFCLISCEKIGPFRDIEINILNADYAVINLYALPEENHIYSTQFDREYVPDGIIHISNIPDGKYKLTIHNNIDNQEISFEYIGVLSFNVDI